MSLTTDLTKALAALKGSCPVARALAAWPVADRTAFSSALADAKVPSGALYAAVQQMSPRLAATDIAHHRAGDCPCVIA